MLFIYLIFLIAFFGNSLVGYGWIPYYFTLANEACIYILFLYSIITSSLRNENYRIHLTPRFILFIIVALCSILFNEMENYRIVVGLRPILRFYLFYLALINLGLDEIKLKKINLLLFFLFIIQIPTAAIKLYFYGIGEKTIGTYALFGGGLSTIIPIVALGFITGFYFFYNSKRLYWVLAIGFIFFGIIGEKAALLFLIPTLFLGIYYLIYIRERRVSLIRGLYTIALVAVLSITISGVIIKYNPRLNREGKVGGSIDFLYALEFTGKYTTSTYSSQYALGRYATTMLALDHIFGRNIGHALFGYGPGSLTKSVFGSTTNKKDARKKDSRDSRIYRIAGSYGITGMVFVLIEYGLCGFVVYILVFIIFCRMCWKWYNREKDPYWKAFSLGSLVFAFFNLFIFIAYNTLPITGDLLPSVYFYVMANMYIRSRKYKELLSTQPQD